MILANAPRPQVQHSIPTAPPRGQRPMPAPSLTRRALCRLLGGHHTNATGACYSCGRR